MGSKTDWGDPLAAILMCLLYHEGTQKKGKKGVKRRKRVERECLLLSVLHKKRKGKKEKIGANLL
jgi:hypothetical protein